MTNNEKISKILKESHLIIDNSLGLEISKTEKEKAKRESRKKLRELKDISPIIYERVKAEFNE
tara:strand:+ start:5539 stop:5727 length:189 start_codon:yes stop_codon:yes gene_type:complete